MKKLLLFLSISLFLNTSYLYSQSGWFQQQSNTSAELNRLFFLNSNTGWVVGDSGKILKTTNGGDQWVQQLSNVSSPLRSVYFLNENTGYATGGVFSDFSFCFIDILKTTNGGNNWFTVFNTVDFDNSASDVVFINSNTGFVICFGGNESLSIGLIFKTTNSGLNWIRSEYNSSFSSIRFTNEITGWIFSNYYHDVIGDSAIIFKTNNSGSSWNKVYSLVHSRINCSLFLNADIGWAAGFAHVNGFGKDLVLKTTNGGNSWGSLNLTSLTFINSICFTNADTGWHCGNGIYRSTDGGFNWISQYSNGAISFKSILFVNNNTGWAAGSNGTILKTVSGGITNIEISNSNLTEDFYLSQNFPNPFNPVTVIRYSIPSDVRGQTSNVKLAIFNSLGKEVATLVNENQTPGSYSVEFNGSNFSSGVYFYRITAGEFTEVRKMTLLK